MEKVGLKGNIVQFVADFLTNRTIRVRVGSHVPNPYPLQNGTPQGSVISPLLFLIMINDIDTPENNVQLCLQMIVLPGSLDATSERSLQTYKPTWIVW